jgi:hypothetical protein
MEIRKDLCKQIGDELANAVAEIAAKHGLTGAVTGGTFDANTFKPRIEFSAPERKANEFARWASSFGLPADLMGRTLTIRGIRYTVTGILPNAIKRPVEMKRESDGRMFAFELLAIRRALGLVSDLTEVQR